MVARLRWGRRRARERLWRQGFECAAGRRRCILATTACAAKLRGRGRAVPHRIECTTAAVALGMLLLLLLPCHSGPELLHLRVLLGVHTLLLLLLLLPRPRRRAGRHARGTRIGGQLQRGTLVLLQRRVRVDDLVRAARIQALHHQLPFARGPRCHRRRPSARRARRRPAAVAARAAALAVAAAAAAAAARHRRHLQRVPAAAAMLSRCEGVARRGEERTRVGDQRALARRQRLQHSPLLRRLRRRRARLQRAHRPPRRLARRCQRRRRERALLQVPVNRAGELQHRARGVEVDGTPATRVVDAPL